MFVKKNSINKKDYVRETEKQHGPADKGAANCTCC